MPDSLLTSPCDFPLAPLTHRLALAPRCAPLPTFLIPGRHHRPSLQSRDVVLDSSSRILPPPGPSSTALRPSQLPHPGTGEPSSGTCRSLPILTAAVHFALPRFTPGPFQQPPSQPRPPAVPPPHGRWMNSASPAPQAPQKVTVFGDRAFKEVSTLKWGPSAWALIQYDWCPYK